MALKQYKPTPKVAGFINPPTTGDTAVRRIRHYGVLTAVLPRDAMLARKYYGPVSVRPSVCPCVTSRCSIKWPNISSCKQRHTMARDSTFLTPRILMKFPWRHPICGAIYTWGMKNLRLSTNNSLYLENCTI